MVGFVNRQQWRSPFMKGSLIIKFRAAHKVHEERRIDVIVLYFFLKDKETIHKNRTWDMV